MSKPLFIDIHMLQSVPPSNINRDDTGSPKTARFGGVLRSRVSSQAWKKATRDLFHEYLNTSQLGVRTKYAVKEIAQKAYTNVGEDGFTDSQLDACKKVLVDHFKGKGESGQLKFEPKNKYKLTTLLFMSQYEIGQLAECVTGEKKPKDLKGRDLARDAIDMGMFGRMVANKPDLNVDAAVQVAHAIGVGRAEPEFDYFTALDDRAPEDNAGAAMIETTEFTSSTLYRYADVDVFHLCENLGSANAACKAIDAFLRAFTRSMPTGKQNSFANRTLPSAIVVQLRDMQPISLVNAFERPVASENGKGQTEVACERLVEQEKAIDDAFGSAPSASFVVCASPDAEPIKQFPNAKAVSFDELVAQVTSACAEYLASRGYQLETEE